MAVIYIKQDITTVRSGVIAHGVNCSGVMNSGVAKAIRAKWPVVYEKFRQHRKGEHALGEVDIVHILTEELVVVNCYTQQFYGFGGGKYADVGAIERSMNRVMQVANLFDYSVYIPKIGCGLGGLNWKKEVEPIIQALDEDYERVLIYVCELPGV